MSSRFLLGALCAVVTITIWAGWLGAMRVGMASHLAVVDLIALRFAVAGIVMVPVVMRRGGALDQLGWTGFAANREGRCLAQKNDVPSQLSNQVAVTQTCSQRV